MKLLSFEKNNQFRIGFVDHNNVVDLNAAFKYFRHDLDNICFGLNDFPKDLLSFIHLWEQVWPITIEIFNRIKFEPGKSIVSTLSFPLKEINIKAPLINPGKIICLGLNYKDYCKDLNLDPPKNPILFSKFPSSIIGNGDVITWSKRDSTKVDYEAELAIIIKKKCYRIQPSEANEYMAGFMVLNDISARDVQNTDVQWVRGKSFDTFCPTGPYLVTSDEVPNPDNLKIQCKVNGNLLQDSSTSNMFFDCATVVSFISQTSTLLPGDIIATGTPNGVAISKNPPEFLKDGDIVEVEIENLGCLVNTVKEILL